MIKINNANHFDNSEDLIRQSIIVMGNRLAKREFKQHIITNNAISYTEKENYYLNSYLNFLKSKNCSYILECK